MSTAEIIVLPRDIPNSPEIKRQAKYAMYIRSRAYQAEEELADMIKKFQEICGQEICGVPGHNFVAVKHKIGDGEIYVGKRCTKCLLFEPRPEGNKFKVCFNCGGNMKNEHIMIAPAFSTIACKCEQCGHEESTM
jgi:hypothetical protein